MSTLKEQLDLTTLGLATMIMKLPSAEVTAMLERIAGQINPLVIEHLQSQKLIENLAAAKSQQALKVIPVPEPYNTTVLEAIVDEIDTLNYTDAQKTFLFIQVVDMIAQAAMTWINEQFRAKGNEILHQQVQNNESRIIKPNY